MTDPVLQRIMYKLQEQRYTCKDLEAHLKIANGGVTKWKNHGGKSYYRHISEIASFLKTTPTYLLSGVIENVGDLTDEEKEFMTKFKAIDKRGQECIIAIMNDFYALSRVAQAIRSESVINTGHNNVYNSGQPAQS